MLSTYRDIYSYPLRTRSNGTTGMPGRRDMEIRQTDSAYEVWYKGARLVRLLRDRGTIEISVKPEHLGRRDMLLDRLGELLGRHSMTVAYDEVNSMFVAHRGGERWVFASALRFTSNPEYYQVMDMAPHYFGDVVVDFDNPGAEPVPVRRKPRANWQRPVERLFVSAADILWDWGVLDINYYRPVSVRRGERQPAFVALRDHLLADPPQPGAFTGAVMSCAAWMLEEAGLHVDLQAWQEGETGLRLTSAEMKYLVRRGASLLRQQCGVNP